MHPLTGCIAKVNRADDHISALSDRIQEFVNDETAYVISKEPDPKAPQDIVLWGESRKDPPVSEWGPIIGDVVHNLRSALDAVVWELSALRCGGAPPEPPPSKSRWRDVGFPIVIVKGDWHNEACRKIPAVGPAGWTTIKGHQPFVTRKNAPDREPLAVLHKLWNIDKHRHPHLVLVLAKFDHLRIAKRYEGANDILLRVIRQQDPGPVEGRTELARVRLIGPPLTRVAGMDVEHDTAFDIAFADGPPAYGAPLMDTLESIRDAVIDVIADLQSEFP